MFPLPVILVGFRDEDSMDGWEESVRQELLNNSANVEFSVNQVSELYSHVAPDNPQKRMFIARMDRTSDIEMLAHLCRSYPGWPAIAIVPAGEISSVIMACMRAGASQVVNFPLDPNDFSDALASIVTQFGFSSEVGRIIAVSGVSGGAGGTTISLNLANEIASGSGRNCVLVDLSLPLGMIATFLDVNPIYNIYDVLADLESADDQYLMTALTQVNKHLLLLPAPLQELPDIAINTADLKRLLERLRRLAPIVVLDLPCNYTDVFFETLGDVDQLVLVAEQSVPSIRGLKLLHATLAQHDLAQHRSLVINRYDSKREGFTCGKLCELLNVSKIWTIANDRSGIVAAETAGKPLGSTSPNSPVLEDIRRLAEHLGVSGMPSIRQPTRSSFFARFVRMMGLGSSKH